MTEATELGAYIARLREQAGIKQNELARRLGWSPAVLSRVESGERELLAEERDQILLEIGTTEAIDLQTVMARKWDSLEPPPLGHPEQNLLWDADNALNELRDLAEKPDIKGAFLRRLEAFQEELKAKALLVRKTDYSIAFLGAIGVGKSTAICRMAGLEVPGTTLPFPTPVLEAGSGGTTVCEVHVRQGPEYGILIEPAAEDHLRREVMVFADVTFRSITGPGDKDAQKDDEGSDGGISKEVARVIRNMSGLTVKRNKDKAGKTTKLDEAKLLAATMPDAHTFGVEILTRMNLPRRDQRDLWYDSRTSSKAPLQWLKETFEAVNNGRHPNVSLPQRIEIRIRDPLLGHEDIRLRIIDTKGVDQSAPRADLEQHFHETHTATILCSSFNDAPEEPVQNLLARMEKAGVRNLDKRTAVLVLPRPHEALAVKRDDDGSLVENAQEGYEWKGDQVQLKLEQVIAKSRPIPAAFFNAREDDATAIRAFVLDRVNAVRELHRSSLKEVIQDAKTLVLNQADEERLEVQRDASRHLAICLDMHGKIEPTPDHVQDSLLSAVRRVHPATVRASVRRAGEWPNLQYAHHIGYGSRLVAASALDSIRKNVATIAENLLADVELGHAHDLIRQVQRLLDEECEKILQKAQLLGESRYLEAIKADHGFWTACESLWGTGQGYRDRVADVNDAWFTAASHRIYGEQVAADVEREWGQLLERIRGLVSIE